MSVTCEKCGADISAKWEEHPNCATVVALRLDNARLREAVEWTMSPEGKRFALQLNWAEFTTELRRMAKEA